MSFEQLLSLVKELSTKVDKLENSSSSTPAAAKEAEMDQDWDEDEEVEEDGGAECNEEPPARVPS